MVQLRLIIRLVLLATLRTAECSFDGLGAMSLGRKISKASVRGKYPIYPPNTVYVPYRGSIQNLLLSTESERRYSKKFYGCNSMASYYGYNCWYWSNETCFLKNLDAPVCRVENANETEYWVMDSFLTDGNPDDDPFPSSGALKRFMHSEPNVAFRVMTPSILEFPEFTTEIAFLPPQNAYGDIFLPLPGNIFVFPKLGGIVATDDSILVDPSCHTNNSCGVPFLTTSVEAVTAPHVALDQYCGETIDLDDTPVLNVFSHTGIGCKLLPEVYTTPNCELTITSSSAITANVTLVNFRKTTCEGYELKFVTFPCEGVAKEVDVCQENSPTVFDTSEGKMQIKLTGSALENWHRYGFIIRLEKVATQCSSDNSVQGVTDDFPQVSTTAPAESPPNSPVQCATDDFSQVSTTAPAESPTDSPVQNPVDGANIDLPGASLEISSATEFISNPAESFESESPSVSPKSPTNPHHLHLLLALGIEL